jgi:hypothetical protein
MLNFPILSIEDVLTHLSHSRNPDMRPVAEALIAGMYGGAQAAQTSCLCRNSF